MKKKIFQSIAITSIVLVTASYFLCTLIIFNDIVSNKRNTLKSETIALSQFYNENTETFLETNFYSESRITLLDQKGTVIFDSRYPATDLADHSDRPEFVDAQVSGIGESIRYSDTLNKKTYYYAVKLNDNNILRLANTSDTLLTTLGSSLSLIVLLLILVFGISIVIARVLTQKIIEPLNRLNLDMPLSNKTYPELQPLLENLNYHNKLRKEFSANVSHELKTPLTSISGYAEIMANNLQGNNTQGFSQKIVDESKHLLRIIEDIMKLSKLDEGKVQLDFEEVDFGDLINQVANNLSEYAENAKIQIVVQAKSVTTLAIRQIAYEIIYNLVQNAIKYNNENGHVWISTDEFNHYVIITVKDDGLGIPDSEKDRIFERFYRSDKSHNRQIDGTGLGLAIVKHGVEFHHGTIEVSNYLNRGTKFTVKIPK